MTYITGVKNTINPFSNGKYLGLKGLSR